MRGFYLHSLHFICWFDRKYKICALAAGRIIKDPEINTVAQCLTFMVDYKEVLAHLQ